MKVRRIFKVFGLSLGLFSLAVLPVNAGGGHGGGGGGGHGGFSGGGHGGFSGGARGGFSGGARGGFSGGAHFSGAGRSYSGAGIRPSGEYAPRSYSSGISPGRYGGYGGSIARPQSNTASRQFTHTPRYSGSYYAPQDRSGVGYARRAGVQPRQYSGTNRDVRQQRAITNARAATRPATTWSRQNLTNRQRLDPQTTERLRNWRGNAPGWNDAKHNNQEHWRDRHHHDHDWWHRHCDAIVFVGGGYWGWWDGWWYPAWGYDPYYSYYDYDGPIYGYDGLQPDQVIADVQSALQQLGYYAYAVDGVLGPATEAAIANYQRDYGLPITGAIDPSTVRSLGLTT
jgi:Putative peptidoglycan binding domain